VSVVANVAINVDSTAAERALKNLSGATDALQRKFDTLPNKLSSGLQGLGSKIKGFGDQLTGLGSVMAGIGAGAALGGFVKAGIEADRTAKTTKALADQYGETAKLTKFASDASDRFGLGQTQAAKAVNDLYGRLRPMGVSLGDVQKTFVGVNNAAAKMNLTAADTDGVMLQLSQAMGSGALQGDELRSVMERLPAVGQAIAKVMGVTVGEIKQLGADGKITTDIIVQAMDELSKMQPPPPDAYKLFNKAMQDLNTTIGTQLLPVFTPLIQKLGELVAKFEELGVGANIAQALLPLGQALLALLDGFLKLPAPVQGLIVQLGVLVGVFALVVAPLGFIISGIGAFVSAVGSLAGVLGSLKILATIAGWLGALGPVIGTIVAAVKGLGAVLLGVFSGPVGWVALAVAAGAAIYAFRDQIGQAFQAIGGILQQAATGFKTRFIDPVVAGFNSVVQFVSNNFVQPVQAAITGLVQMIGNTFKNVTQAITAPFQAAFQTVRGIVNSILSGIGRAVSGVVQAVNNIIRGANGALARMRLPQIPMLPMPQIPQFADGGVVTKPTVAMIGEGGEPEYIVPQSKAAGFAANYLSGARGSSAIPSGGGGGAAPTISIQTGPVTQMNGQNYVTTQDLSRAVQAGVQQTLNMMRNDRGTRRAVGLA
jgi:tape measure domain-containing protein